MRGPERKSAVRGPESKNAMRGQERKSAVRGPESKTAVRRPERKTAVRGPERKSVRFVGSQQRDRLVPAVEVWWRGRSGDCSVTASSRAPRTCWAVTTAPPGTTPTAWPCPGRIYRQSCSSLPGAVQSARLREAVTVEKIKINGPFRKMSLALGRK